MNLLEISGIATKTKVKLVQKMQEVAGPNENAFPSHLYSAARFRVLYGFKVVMKRTPGFYSELQQNLVVLKLGTPSPRFEQKVAKKFCKN